MAGVGWFDAALAGAFLAALVVLAATLRQRDAPSARYLALMLLGTMGWTGTAFLQRFVTDPGLSYALAVGIYVGSFLLVTTYPFFALVFAGYRDRITSGLVALVWLVPLALLVLMVTNLDGGALWRFTPGKQSTLNTEGPAFWVYVVYAYVLNAIGTVILLRAALRSNRLYQSQAAAVVVAVFAPWLANVLFLFGPLSVDLTPIAFAVSGGALYFAIRQFRLLDVTPIARETLVDTIDAGMLVLDDEDRVVDTNETMRAWFELDDGATGQPVREILAGYPQIIDALTVDEEAPQVVPVAMDDADRFLEVGMTPVGGDDGAIANLYLLQDVSDRERREQRLRKSEQRYRTLAENFPRGVVSLFDEDRRYYLVEGGVFDSIDLDETDFEGRTIEEAHTASFVGEFGPLFDAVFEGERHTFEFTHDDRVYRTRLVPVTDEGGDVVAGMSMTTDITELKDRERELERYETVVETVPDGVYLIDESATVITANRRGATMLGYEPGTLEGRTIDSFIEDGVFEPSVRQRFEAILAELLSADSDRQGATYTHEVTPIDGDPRIVEAHVAILPYEDEYAGLAAVYRDVTDRERAMQELERQNEHLEQFASVVSHDLRNPLNIANSRVELARETGDLEHLEGAVEAHERMDRLIDDVLALARQGKLVTETAPVSLESVTREAWSQVAAPDATLTVTADRHIEADRGRLTQLLQNCLHNAVRHGGETVAVTVGPLEDGGGQPGGFYVADDGPGIPPEDRDSIFEYGTTGHEAGTGLGLAIVRQIAEGHGWTIDVTESEAGGARFEFGGVRFTSPE